MIVWMRALVRMTKHHGVREVRNARYSAADLHVALQVAFNALIPCMLFTKVGATLAARPDPALLAIPLVAAAQARRRGPVQVL